MDPLREDLCRLASRLDAVEVRPMLAGGYGLILKAEYLEARDLRTRAPTTFPRATQDLDLVLRSEVVADAARLGAVEEALEELGYRPVPGRENYQWHREVEVGSRTETVKVDLLGQIPEDRTGISVRDRRMRPHRFTGLHANPLAEAAFVHVRPLRLAACEGGQSGMIELPHPFNYMLLKLFAFEDRKDDETVEYGRHHAFDLYRIVAMLTADEWDEVVELRARYEGEPLVADATEFVRESFGDDESLGMLRLREYVRGASMVLDAYSASDFREDFLVLWLE